MALPIETAPDLGGDDAAFVRAAVAEEVRSALARKKVSGAELARRLHKSEAWVSRRTSLVPELTFDLVELSAVASVLGVAVKELIPDSVTGRYPQYAQVRAALDLVHYVGPDQMTLEDAPRYDQPAKPCLVPVG